jgi:bifunctional UDP-N-acetylglucosamine pyrophosphorylase/glucosamine-1-phosphate N-acetyltransferase
MRFWPLHRGSRASESIKPVGRLRQLMATPLSELTAQALWPGFAGSEVRGQVPEVPEHDEPVWLILDPDNDAGLKAQLATLLDRFGHVVPDSVPDSVSIDETSGPVCIDDRANIGECVRIEGPCYIGPDVEVRHGAYVRPNSWLCEGSVLGHSSEMKHSLLLPGAKAPHFNYVGDSILGRGVNLGAGCKLSNLRNDERSVLVRGLTGGDMDSGLRKFGAILGDGVAIGCNAVTNPGVIIGSNSNVWPNVTVSGVHSADSTLRE